MTKSLEDYLENYRTKLLFDGSMSLSEFGALETLEKAKSWFHEHDGFPEHPVAVKFHAKYFAHQPKVQQTSARQTAEEAAQQTVEDLSIATPVLEDTRSSLVGTYTYAYEFGRKGEGAPSKLLESSGFKHLGYRDTRPLSERSLYQSPSLTDRIEIYLHPILGRLEIQHITESGEDWVKQRTDLIINPNPSFIPDLRDPLKLTAAERIKSRQRFLSTFMSAEAQQRWEGAAQAHNLTVSEFKSAVVDALKPLMTKSAVWIRLPPSSLRKVLQAKRFRTMSELHRSGGKAAGVSFKNYTVAREEEEEKLFGIPVGQIPEQRPIYGYLSDNANGNGTALADGRQMVDVYGTVAIRLKPSVRAQTTITVGDSLDLNSSTPGSGRVIPAFIDDIKPEMTLGGEQLLDKHPTSILGVTYDYVEAQIHGGVSLQDVEEVVFHEEPPVELIEKLNHFNIKSRVIERSNIGRPEKRGER